MNVPQPLSRRSRPLVAGLLNALFCVGGLGYLYAGQRPKALWAFALTVAGQGVNFAGTFLDLRFTALTLFPLLFVFQVLTGLDVYLVLRRHRQGDSVHARSTAVPLLAWMGTPLPALPDDPAHPGADQVSTSSTSRG